MTMESVSSSSSLLSTGSDDSKSSSSSSDIVFENQYSSEKYLPYDVVYVTTSEKYKPGDHSSRESARGRFSARRAAIAALVLSLMCLLVTVGACCTVYYMHLRQRGNAGDPSEEVCLPCIQVNPDPLQAVGRSPLLDKLDKRYIEENDTEICCAKTPAQYATLFKLILKRQEGVKKLADILGTTNNDDNDGPFKPRNGTSVSAHLVIKPPSPEDFTESSKTHPKQPWKSPQESPISHVRGGLRFHDNQLLVETPGLYFVYCQILYMNGGSGDVSEPQVASNYVKRTSILYPGTSGILLKSRHTRYNADSDRHSNYAGGLFFLHEGDSLYVQVAVPELVSHDDTASFFGLFRVGD